MDRRAFTTELIKAIEDLGAKQEKASPAQLADSAFKKLQYDFAVSCRVWSMVATCIWIHKKLTADILTGSEHARD